LEQVQPANLECISNHRQIQPPGPIHGFVDEAQCFIASRVKPGDPLPESLYVMLPPVFHVADFEPRVLSAPQGKIERQFETLSGLQELSIDTQNFPNSI
jgi:hypothetical protein